LHLIFPCGKGEGGDGFGEKFGADDGVSSELATDGVVIVESAVVEWFMYRGEAQGGGG